MLTIFVERDDPDVCFIGRAADVRRGVVWLQEINPNGRWDAAADAYDVHDVTRIDVGGGYEATLLEVAGEAPKIKKPGRLR